MRTEPGPSRVVRERRIEWRVTLLILVGMALAGCRMRQAAPVAQRDTEVADRPSITEFVHRTYFHGVPYADAAQFGQDDVQVLLLMLADPREERYLSNIVVTLCMIGDASVADRVIEFVEETPAGAVSPARAAAKLDAVMALGYVVNRTDSRAALDYLKASLNPDAWTNRNVTWQPAFHDTAAQRNTQLSTRAALGLALSGHAEAREALERAQRQPDSDSGRMFAAQASGTIAQALEDHARIAQVGLVRYYQEQRQP